MIRLRDIKLPVESDTAALYDAVCKKLRIRDTQIETLTLRRRSIDARKKPELYYVYTVDLNIKDEIRRLPKGAEVLPEDGERYHFPNSGTAPLHHRPIIVGAGPAGLFAALLLAQNGYRPLILERGKEVDARVRDVSAFWAGAALKADSNVQFGEGGAGTFSDGKLSSGIKDPLGRNRLILESFVRFGADPAILYEQLPHVGTDVLRNVLYAMRQEITALGGSYQFETKVTDLYVKDGALAGLFLEDGSMIPCEACIFAPGHAAKDSFLMLSKHLVAMEEKAFAVGLRIEHPQEMIDMARFGRIDHALGPASYKLTHRAQNGRAVYSFCMCPGGYVVNASSDEGLLCINGMSNAARDSKNANAAIIVSVTPDDFRDYYDQKLPQALQGFSLQETLSRRAYQLADGAIPQQTLKDFAQGITSTAYGSYASCAKGSTAFADLSKLLPAFLSAPFLEGIHAFARQIPHFDRPDAILSAVESRTSSPLRVLRDADGLSSLPGLYPCGEGCGYAGGILSSAADGIKCAEFLAQRYAKLSL